MKKTVFLLILTVLIINISACLNKPASIPGSNEMIDGDISLKTNIKIDEIASFTDVPALGPYLEATGKKVRVSYNSDGEVVKTEAIDDGTSVKGKYSDVYKTGSNVAKTVTDFVIKNYPDFKIIGYVYSNVEPFQEVYPIGYYKDSPYIQYFYNQPVDFLLVDKFKTIEEGRQAFEDYMETRENILSQTPVLNGIVLNTTH